MLSDKEVLAHLAFATDSDTVVPELNPHPNYPFESQAFSILSNAVRLLARELYDLKYGKLEDSAEPHVPYLDAN